MKTKFLMIAGILAASIALPQVSAQKVVILATNDTHSQIDPAPDGMGGLLRRRAAIDQVRRQNKHVITVDAGDDVQGTLYFSLYGGKVEFAALDSLGYDVAVLGNHEFDNGADSLAYYYNRMSTPHVSTNYDMSASPMAGHFQPYVIKAVGDKRIAFIGINLNPKGMISDGNYRGVRYLNPFGVADEMARFLKQSLKVDFVTMVSHIGYNNPVEPSDSAIAARSHYIDLVIGAHSHTLLRPNDPRTRVKNADGREIRIGQNGKSGKYVGRYDVDLDNGQVQYSQIAIDSTLDSAAAQYPAMERWLAGFRHGVDSLMQVPVARTARFIDNESSTAQNWLSDASLAIVREISGNPRIDFAIMNKGGIRQDFNKGVISEGLLTSTFPFNNRFVALQISGADLLDALAVMAQRDGDAISRELRVTYNSQARITSAKLNGKKIDPRKTYTIATIDYLANGGDYMAPFKRAKRIFSDNVAYGKRIMNYVKQQTAKGRLIDSTDEVRMRKQ